jgi:hypothetical protein
MRLKPWVRSRAWNLLAPTNTTRRGFCTRTGTLQRTLTARSLAVAVGAAARTTDGRRLAPIATKVANSRSVLATNRLTTL